MRLSDLTEGQVTGAAGAIEITGLTADSRQVEPGFLFAAMPGSRLDGATFAAEAVARGAVAVLAPPASGLGALDAPVIEDADPRLRFALMAARFFGAQPSMVAAVTGTNGKTSVADFTRQIWVRLGFRAASLGTLGVIGPGGVQPLAHTSPEPAQLHALLKGLADDGVDHLAIEASSHGLDQRRLDGLRITAGAFTSFSRDHLDYHPTADDYLAAKLRLFGAVMDVGGIAVLNADIDVHAEIVSTCTARKHEIITYGAADSDLRLHRRVSLAGGQRLELEVFGIRSDIELPLVGDFQAMNALCALGLTIACGADRDRALAILPELKGVPGRLEHVAGHPSGAAAYVDYAHTPDALERALQALRPHTQGRLIVVFGCGGDRDRGKRPQMGAIAARLADVPIVTDDNPRGEDPAAIRAEVLPACPGGIEVGDRADAIRAGVGRLNAGDVLLVAGKGHEQGQIVGDEVRPFDDAAEVRRAVAELAGGAG